jgi:phytoene dehydrogenase-like protein
MKQVIIIGSGIGGLVVGNLLIKKGHKVTIFESHTAPGGYTAGFWRKGFYFESGTLSFEASPSVFKAMKDIGVFDKIDFVRQKMRWVSEDFDGIPESYGDFKDMLFSAYPSEKDGLTGYFSEVGKMYDAMGSENKPMPVLYSGLSYFLSMASFMLNLKAMRLYQKYANVTIDEFTEQFFERDSKVYRTLKSIGYPEMGAWIIGGTFATIAEDYWTVKSGMQSWANVLADNFEESGGELKLKSYVDKIITQNGVVVGISCDNVDYDADYIISASDYKKTFLKLLDNQSLIPGDLLEKIEAAPVSEGMFTVYLGLNLSNDELREHMKIPHVAYFDEKPDVDINNPDDQEFFQKSSVMLYSPSLMNSELAPEGKSSLMLQAVTPHQWMQNWGGGDKQRYKELKDNVKKTLIQKASAVVPNLADLIEFEDAATPLTYEKFTHNTDGATSAWSWNPKKKFHKQPMGAAVDTPVKNLYIGSCWATQIGGVPSAIAAAYQCVKKVK